MENEVGRGGGGGGRVKVPLPFLTPMRRKEKRLKLLSPQVLFFQ